ncbi:hypothetical protein EJV46_05925 [Roseococcus sp. SYP-B2431]|uniref:hypothetical protein n=1 Tax=Roseococcus sp. SYP-B2431 TaxID=2496640 RepID=UPI00103AD1EC|nr:hypothetical protein [Roseococcus sp. SYP-B2431]TCI00185.1 hypothetical protein EJV46_05925 [Roseococcus sp. SYP-B2431]
MSQKNNDGGAGMGALFILVIIAATRIFIYAIAVFVSLGLTLIYLVALSGPLRLGKWYITPAEAKSFILRGVIGAATAPLLAVFVASIFGERIPSGAWIYIILGGYALASVGFDMLVQEEGGGQAVEYIPRQEDAALPPPASRPPQPPPFRFASWDDEENGR